MSEGTDEFEEGESCENQCGLILGCWDHEKTATIIQDLERSVNLIQKKCIRLFEELVQYKKYLDSGGKHLNLSIFKKRSKKSKNCHLFSGSEPDIAFRKNFLNFQEVKQVFEEKFQAKLCNINEELKEAAHKIGLKDNILLLHASDYLKGANEEEDCETEKSDVYTPEEFIKLNFRDAKTKSDTIIIERVGEEAEFSKITKNELELYQKLSKLSVKSRRKRKKLKGRKVKYCVKMKSSRCRQGLSTGRSESKKCNKRKKKKKKRKKLKKTAVRRSGCRSPPDSSSAKCSREDSSETKIEKMCKSLNEALGARKANVLGEGGRGRGVAVERSESLGAAIRKAVPFTACASTSRSYNIGLNVQQLLFLTKHGRKMNAPEKSHGDGRTQPREGVEWKKSENGDATGCGISWSKRGGVENDEIRHDVEQKEKVWIAERNKTNFRKVRSKYTGSSPEGFLEYHKSTMSQYTSGRKSMIKSESQRAYAVGSKIMVSDCRRTDVFEVAGNDGGFENASGDFGNAELSTEWMKVYGSFLNMCRKYSTLKEKLNGNHSVSADGELQSLEEEIDCSIAKYKDFLQFYSKFLHLNHRLKSLKIACQSKPETSITSDFQKKLCGYRPTSSTTMKKTLREVQALQEKIRLVNA